VEDLIAWCGFFGAWLLFAGPVYQAALELHEQDIERGRIAEVSKQVPAPARISPWWWLLPPVRYVKERRRARRYRDAVMGAMRPDELEALVTYINKATGWLFVGLGGLLLAVKETWELHERYEWRLYAFWVLVAVMTAIAATNVAIRLDRSRRYLEST
jgi:hypothetical protein